jgi:dUTPase
MNTSDKPQIIDFVTKIVQFVPYEFDNSEIEVVSNVTKEEFYSDMTFNNRGDGAFGSTTLTN